MFDPLETTEFAELECKYYNAIHANDLAGSLRGRRAIREFIYQHFTPKPKREELKMNQTRKVVREFKDSRKGITSIFTDQVGMLIIGKGSYTHCYRVSDIPELVKTLTEVHDEATKPEPVKCPFCGSIPVVRQVPTFDQKWRVICPDTDCHLQGPLRFNEATALASFAKIRVEEGQSK